MIISTVHRPTLSTEERARRMEDIKQAAVQLVLHKDKTQKSSRKRRTP